MRRGGGKSKWRRMVGKLNKALSLAWRQEWRRVAAVAHSTQSWANPLPPPGEDKEAWVQTAGERRKVLRRKQRARLGRERLRAMRQAVARRADMWRGGEISAVLQPLLRGRRTGALVTVTTADGRLHVRPGRVRSHLRRYFEGVFDNEG